MASKIGKSEVLNFFRSLAYIMYRFLWSTNKSWIPNCMSVGAQRKNKGNFVFIFVELFNQLNCLKFSGKFSNPDLDRLINKVPQAPSIRWRCVIPITVPYSDFDCAFMIVSIENQKMALTSIALWYTWAAFLWQLFFKITLGIQIV